MIDPTAQIARGVRDHRCDEFDIELGSNREKLSNVRGSDD
jgi:hypothetical protein